MNTNILNKKLLVAGLLLVNTGMSSIVSADDWQFHVAGAVTSKSLDDDGWRAQNIDGLVLKQESYLGAMFDMKKSSWPVAISLDTFVTGDSRKSSGFEEIGASIETHLGVRKYWGSKKEGWEIYAGGGIAFIATTVSSEFESTKVSQDDSDTGYWVGGGANWYFTDSWYAGADIRYSTGTLEVFEQKRDVDAAMVGLTIGYAF